VTEASQVRAALRRHLGPHLRLVPFSEPQAVRRTGVPDHYWIGKAGALRGVSGWIESKLIPANGAAPEHFTLEQEMWGREEVAAGGRWHLLGLVESRPARWVLYDAPRGRAWREGIANDPLLAVSGRFPTREILREFGGALAERERRAVRAELMQEGL